MGKSKKTTTTQSGTQSTGIDANSQSYVDRMRQYGGMAGTAAQGYSTQGLTGLQQQGMQGMGQDLSQLGPNLDQYRTQVSPLQIGGPQGYSPQAYNPQSAQAYMNPYQQQVIDATQQDFARQREGAMTQSAQQATAAGAFGGNRGGMFQAENVGNANQGRDAGAAPLEQLRAGPAGRDG
jgi:hypothetical protein